MKNLFLVLVMILMAFSQYISWKHRAAIGGGDVQELHWGTVAHQSKDEQARMFVKWMDLRGVKNIKVVIEPESSGPQKFILQAVSGVAPDMEEYSGASSRLFHEIGLLHPLDDYINASISNGYTMDPATREEVTIGGNIYSAPAGIWSRLIIYNTETLARYGLSAPASILTWEQFEALGRQFVKKAAVAEGTGKNFFFAQVGTYPVETIRRSLGLGRYNESFTAPLHRDPRYKDSLDRIYRWVYQDKIMMSPADTASLSMEQGIGGPNVQMFCKGHLAALLMPMWPLMQVRQISNVPMAASLLPHGGYPNSDLSVRCIGVYSGGKHLDVALPFVGFFTSPEYGKYLIGIGDSAPSDPKMLNSSDFMKPTKFANEWSYRETLVSAHQNYAIPNEYCPFILTGIAEKAEEKLLQSFFTGIVTSKDAGDKIATLVELEIKKYLQGHPDRVEQWKKSVARQEALDQMKKELGIPMYGTPEELKAVAHKLTKKLPLAMIDNPYYKKYYVDMGVAE